ncbi:hypothetical protein JCM6882_002498 [Rhodosporidiobolus microsporus]
MTAALPAPAPSAKALGKRRQDSLPGGSSTAAPPSKKQRPHTAQVKAVQKQERRVTRSSLGGAKGKENDANDDGAGPDLYLPLKTPILLTTRAGPNLRHHPPPPAASVQAVALSTASAEAGPSNANLPGSEVVANEAPKQELGQEPEVPLFRLLDESEFLPPRGSRHAPVPEVDTSDAFYLRLHRYPEVLERRASRLERERLIHERSKLINDLEELRGRTWVYAGTSAGGRAEEERQRRIREMEEKLARYDVLLPNQPRKSNFLNLGGGGGASAALPLPLSHRQLSPSRRTASPAPSLPAPRPRTGGPSTRGNPVAASSSSGRTGTGAAPPDLDRPSTPLSASAAGNGTTIRIKFGPPSATSSPAPASPRHHKPSSSRPPGRHSDANASLDRYTLTGELRKGPKRDRKAERARAEERKRLGLAPRANIDKHLFGTKVEKRKSVGGRERSSGRRGSEGVSYVEGDEDEEEDELDSDSEEGEEEEEEEEEDEGEEGADEWDEVDSETGRPIRTVPARRRASSSAAGGAAAAGASAPPVRLRLRDSFFSSAALRDSVMAPYYAAREAAKAAATAAAAAAAATGTGGSAPTTTTTTTPSAPRARRSSARVAYAFGQRLPDAALLQHAEFEPHGGVAGDSEDEFEGHSRTRLEDMLRERMERNGAKVVILGRQVIPKSALDAWALGPINVSPVKGGGGGDGGSVATTLSDADPLSRAASPASFVAANGATITASSGAALNGHSSLSNVFAPPSPSPAVEPSPPPRPAPVHQFAPPLSLNQPEKEEGVAIEERTPPPPPMSLSMPGALPT